MSLTGSTWHDVVLPDDSREQLMDLVNVFSRPDLARSLGIQPPPGILLHGPPGTGKTTIARAMATEVHVGFYEQSAADLLSTWAEDPADGVARLFATARANRPAIVFVDEIEGLRPRGWEADRCDERALSQFVREVHLLGSGSGVFLVGATNRPDVVDPVKRELGLVPIEIGLPDAAGRLQLLRKLLAPAGVAPDVDLLELAVATEGMSGADLERLCDLAATETLPEGAGAAPATTRIGAAELASALQRMRRRATFAVV